MTAHKIYREEFETGGQFLAAVIAAADGERDPRLEFMAAATGAGEQFPSEGGFAAPVEWTADLWRNVIDTGEILGRCRRIPVSSEKIKIPAIDESSRADGSRWGALQSFWVEEGEAPTASRPKFREMELHPHKQLVLAYASNELAADAPALEAWFEMAFRDEVVHVLESVIFNGSGAGKPLGFVNSGAVIEVAKEGGQSASTILPANLKAMAARFWSASFRNGVWIMGVDGFNQLADTQFANGTPTITYGPNGGRFALGWPIIVSEHPMALGTPGDIVLVDLSQYIVAEREMEFLSSLHVRFVNDERAFKIRYRIDGQPAWAAPIAPKDSSTTQSAFISLAERA